MSTVARQERLFAAESFEKVYQTFQNIDFTAYDYTSIRDSLIENIRINYPDEFNDFTADSEYVALIELLSYLATSLAFRADLNARDNILDTATRRESIIRLARMISYSPKRNLPANGFLKVKSVMTNESLRDSFGRNLSNRQIFWNDQNNQNWFENFIMVLNSTFNETNPFGRPSSSAYMNNVKTDLYQMNNVQGLDVAFSSTANVNGESMPFDLVNSEITDGILREKHPDQNSPFSLIYRNDTQGPSSIDNGFFFYFRQGSLSNTDIRFDFPEPNRILDIDVDNINENDVYVQEILDDGTVENIWTKVPNIPGSNVNYNQVNPEDRRIFEVLTRPFDRISIKFPDGDFGEIPTGIFRVWHRKSAGRKITIRPEDMRGLQVTIPYYGKDNREYRLTLSYDLEYTVSNGSPAETNEEVRIRAPRLYYTQDRMINNDDYNSYPLIRGNEIKKVKSLNRTFSGHSRYIDAYDPTGFHSGLTILGEDGALYNENRNTRMEYFITSSIAGEISRQLFSALQGHVRNRPFFDFFESIYVPYIRDLDPSVFDIDSENIFWEPVPDAHLSFQGRFVDSLGIGVLLDGNSNTAKDFIMEGSRIKLEHDDEIVRRRVQTIRNQGEIIEGALNPAPITLSKRTYTDWKVTEVTPSFRTTFNESERQQIIDAFDGFETFAMFYDVINDEWTIQSNATVDVNQNFNDGPNSSWFAYVRFYPSTPGTDARYEFLTRGNVTVFESFDSVKFFWDPDQKILDYRTGSILQDIITLVGKVNQDTLGNVIEADVKFTPSGRYLYDDGYLDTSKIDVIPADVNDDSVNDNQLSFFDFVDKDNEVVLKRFYDMNGYQRSSVWLGKWAPYDGEVLSVAVNLETMSIIDTSTLITYRLEDFEILAARIRYNLNDNESIMAQQVPGVIAAFLQNQINFGSIVNRDRAFKFIEYFQNNNVIKFGYPGNVDSENHGRFYNFELSENNNTFTVSVVRDERYYSRTGFSFDQNIDGINRRSLLFKWNHYVPRDQRVDPSRSNIIDMIVMTDNHYREVLEWKRNRKPLSEMPKPPTTYELSNNLMELNKHKSISDEVVYKSGNFKVLFGVGAEDELKAKFKVVKVKNTNITDNEIKSGVIKAIDEYFSIENWDFGERFFFTELAAFIHHKLSRSISSVVIVPENESSEFGNLFEIQSRDNEIFISTATVENVEIVSNYNERNLRM